MPIVDAAGEVAARNVSVHAGRSGMDELRDRFLPEVPATARAIERDANRGAS